MSPERRELELRRFEQLVRRSLSGRHVSDGVPQAPAA